MRISARVIALSRLRGVICGWEVVVDLTRLRVARESSGVSIVSGERQRWGSVMGF